MSVSLGLLVSFSVISIVKVRCCHGWVIFIRSSWIGQVKIPLDNAFEAVLKFNSFCIFILFVSIFEDQFRFKICLELQPIRLKMDEKSIKCKALFLFLPHSLYNLHHGSPNDQLLTEHWLISWLPAPKARSYASILKCQSWKE